MKKIMLTVWALLLTASVSTGAVIAISGSSADNRARSNGAIGGGLDKYIRIGNDTSTTGIFTAWVIPFLLPELGSESIAAASIHAYVESIGGLPATSTVSLDLLGVRVDAANTVLWSDYQGTIVGDNLYSLTSASIPLGAIEFSSAGLATYLQSIYDNDANAAGKYVFLSIAPDAGLPTYKYAQLTTANGDAVTNRPVLHLITKDSSAVSKIISLKPVAGNVVEMLINTTDTSEAYVKAATNLVAGSFESVAHSSDGISPFAVTNLNYSTAIGSNRVIYLDAHDSARFFTIGGRPATPGDSTNSTPVSPTNNIPAGSLNDTLVWVDEFDGTSVDASKWDVIDGAALYTKIYMRAQNSTVSGGKLNLTYNKEDFGGASYSGARVQTKDKFPFLYGKVEIRAKVANTPGTWDAFWLFAQENSFWNEIDGFEIHGNNRNVVPMNYHWGTLATRRDKATFFSDGTTWANDYHIYTIDWTPTNLTWYIDGVVRKTETANVCNRPMFIILDTEMNTNELSVSSSFPQVFSIDYVKVYQSSNPCTVTVDKLDDYSKVYSLSSNLELKTDNPNYYVQGGQPKSDGSRVGLTSEAQSTQEYLIYNVPSLKDFAANYYYSGAYSTAYSPKFYTSANSNGPWVEFAVSNVANELNIGARWEMRGINGFGVPAGTSFLKIEFPALGASYGNVQLGEVILVSQ